MSQPLVSAIIPAYNRPERTQRALESVSAQTYSPIELVIVDDGSQPPLHNELSVPESAFQEVVFKVHKTNQGGNVARNTGIENASGQYLAFLDSDDEWGTEKIQQQITRLEQSEAEASYTGVKQLDSNGEVNVITKATLSGDILSDLLNGNTVGTFSSVVIQADVVDRLGNPDPDLPSWQDWEWYLRLAANGVQFDAINEPLTIRHNEGDQISQSYAPKRNESYPVIKSRIKEFTSTAKQEQIALSNLDFQLGYSALVNEYYPESRQLFLNSIRMNWRNIKSIIYLFCTGPHYSLVRHTKRFIIRKTS